jgi:hypothetical protein
MMRASESHVHLLHMMRRRATQHPPVTQSISGACRATGGVADVGVLHNGGYRACCNFSGCYPVGDPGNSETLAVMAIHGANPGDAVPSHTEGLKGLYAAH